MKALADTHQVAVMPKLTDSASKLDGSGRDSVVLPGQSVQQQHRAAGPARHLLLCPPLLEGPDQECLYLWRELGLWLDCQLAGWMPGPCRLSAAAEQSILSLVSGRARVGPSGHLYGRTAESQRLLPALFTPPPPWGQGAHAGNGVFMHCGHASYVTDIVGSTHSRQRGSSSSSSETMVMLITEIGNISYSAFSSHDAQ